VTTQPVLWDGEDFWKLSNPNSLITYEDSDLSYLKYANRLRPARRGEGRTTRVLRAVADACNEYKNVLHFSHNHAMADLCASMFVSLFGGVLVRRGGKPVVRYGASLVYFHSKHDHENKLRGLRDYVVLRDHYDGKDELKFRSHI